MADHSKPVLTSNYTNFLSEIDGRLDDLAVGLDPAVTTATSLPINSIAWSSTDKNWKKWNGTAWVLLSSSYNIDLTGPCNIINSSASPGITVDAGTGIYAISSNGKIQVSGGYGAGLVLFDISAASTHGLTEIARNNDNMLVFKTKSNAEANVSDDYLMAIGPSGATSHEWRLSNVKKLKLDSTGLTLTSPNNDGSGGLVVESYKPSVTFSDLSATGTQGNLRIALDVGVLVFEGDTSEDGTFEVRGPSITVSGGLSTAKTSVTSEVSTDGNILSGTYTPTITNGTNVSASTAYTCHYMRVGNVVTLSGALAVTTTAANTYSTVDISIPVASDFGNSRDAAGTLVYITSVAGSSGYGNIASESTNNRLQLRFSDGTSGVSHQYQFTCTYRVI